MNHRGVVDRRLVLSSIAFCAVLLMSSLFIFAASKYSDASSIISNQPSSETSSQQNSTSSNSTGSTTDTIAPNTSAPDSQNVVTPTPTADTTSAPTSSPSTTENKSSTSANSTSPTPTTSTPSSGSSTTNAPASTSSTSQKSTTKTETSSNSATNTKQSIPSTNSRVISNDDPKKLIASTLSLARIAARANDTYEQLTISFLLPYAHTKVALGIESVYKAEVESNENGQISHVIKSKFSTGTHAITISGKDPLNTEVFSVAKSFIIEPAKAATSLTESAGIRDNSAYVLKYLLIICGIIFGGIMAALIVYRYKQRNAYELLS